MASDDDTHFHAFILRHLGSDHHISLKTLKKCMDWVSQEYGISSHDLRKELRRAFGTPRTTTASDQTIVYEGRKISVRDAIPDVDLINQNPYKYLETHYRKFEDLERFVKLAGFLYYNFGTSLSDNAYDAIEYEYQKRLNAKTKTAAERRLQVEPVEKLRVDLPFTMPSLNKVKPDSKNMQAFLQGPDGHRPSPKSPLAPAAIMWSHKLDGVSCMLVYKDGAFDAAYTSAHGIVGSNVSYIQKHIRSIPSRLTSKALRSTRLVVIRGELIMKDKVFAKKYQHEYATPRNYVVACVNSGHLLPGVSDIDFVAYEVKLIETADAPRRVKDRISPSPSAQFDLLEKEVQSSNGEFLVVEHGLFEHPTVAEIMFEYLGARTDPHRLYRIDGLVLRYDIEVPLWTSAENPPYSVGFKMVTDDQIQKTSVLDVEWNETRHGLLFPVVIYEAVFLDGKRFKRASGLSGRKVVKEWKLHVGSQIDVILSGDVIPQVHKVYPSESTINEDEIILPSTSLQPVPQKEWMWNANGTNIVLREPEHRRGVQIARLVHFFSIVKIPGLGPGKLATLWESGLTTVEDLTNASADQFIVRGISAAGAQKYYESLHETLKTVKLDRLIIASTTFQAHINHHVFKQLLRRCPEILDYSPSQIRKALDRLQLSSVKETTKNKLVEGIPLFRAFLRRLNDRLTTQAIAHHIETVRNSHVNQRIAGKKFVLSNFGIDRDATYYDFEDVILDNDGIIAAKVDSTISAVVTKLMSSVTTKMKMAKALGVPILTIPEFEELYHVGER